VYKGVASGEFPSGITMEYAGYRYKKGGAAVEVVYPSDGTVAYTEGAAIIKGSKNLENAKKFMDWASGLEARKKIVSEFMRRPARPDIDFNALVPGMVALSQVNQIKNYDQARWTKERPQALKRVKDILLRVK
jgi:iron(III) transport system substrate-binding protein